MESNLPVSEEWRRPPIVEDTVEYHVFFPESDQNQSSLLAKRTEILCLLDRLHGDYIWQRDAFELRIGTGFRDAIEHMDARERKMGMGGSLNDVDGDEADAFSTAKSRARQEEWPLHLYGRTQFGENIDDEWFIVYFLMEITKLFDTAVISIFDSDGQFLLIEAAEVIPKWVQPKNSDNRVFLFQGHFHIIPIPRTPSELALIPSSFKDNVKAALHIVWTQKINTKVSKEVADTLLKRVNRYPKKASEFQYTNCLIPRPIAYLLQKNPKTVSAAVESFYYRDMIDIRACRAMKEIPVNDVIMYPVKLTRCLYAQLQRQSFQAPAPFRSLAVPVSHPNYKSFDLGMKIACGFEIFLNNSRKNIKMKSGAQLTHSEIKQDPSWISYNRKLGSLGYYRDEIAGSKLYQELETKAIEYYLTSLPSSEKLESRSGDKAREIFEHLKAGSSLVDEEIQKRPDDSDEWMYIDPEELDTQMAQSEAVFQELSRQKRAAKKTGGSSETDVMEEKEAKVFQDIVNGFRTFMKTESTHKGAEIPNLAQNADDPFDVDFEKLVKTIEQLGSHGVVDGEDEEDGDDDDDDDYDDPLYDDLNALEDSDEDGENSGDDQDLRPDGISFKSYMKAMEAELSSKMVSTDATPGKKPSRPGSNGLGEASDSNGERSSSVQPVDVDVNLVMNILESYRAQAGFSGPASALFGAMGIQLPDDEDESEEP